MLEHDTAAGEGLAGRAGRGGALAVRQRRVTQLEGHGRRADRGLGVGGRRGGGGSERQAEQRAGDRARRHRTYEPHRDLL
jgi:hypothetical protein